MLQVFQMFYWLIWIILINIFNIVLVNTRKYASNISNIILTNIAAVAAVANDTRYSKLDGTNTRTGALKFNNLTQSKVISLYDTGNNFQFVGIGANSGLVSSQVMHLNLMLD